MTVELGVVPHEVQHLIVVGSVVRKPANVVAAWLRSLAWQVSPQNTNRIYIFADDGCTPDARALLDQFVAERGGMVWNSPTPGVPDFSDEGGTHQWTQSAMDRVGALKDQILQFARDNRAEAAWLVDADLILDPMVFASAWSIPQPVISSVFWTRWNKVPEGSPPLHAGPQVWLTHPYGLSGHGMEEWEFRRRLIERRITRVFGLGACTLIRRDALMRGVAFAKWPGNTLEGIGQGEDRHFCMRAEALHIELYADGWPDIFHIYHRPEDEQKIEEMTKRLSRESEWKYWGSVDDPQPRGIALGDLVSLELQALEPVPMATGWQHAPTQFIRGRLGTLTLHPELEQAIVEMTRGEVRIVPVHFGLDWPFPPYRGQRRLIRVRLIDHKPHGFPPVIEEELIRNDIGSVIDTTTISPELLDQMREIHA